MIETTCPKCDTVNHVGDELIGRYTICDNCHCRFYVEVPPLEQNFRAAGRTTPVRESPAAAPTTTLDDLLLDTQKGSRYLVDVLTKHRRLLERTNWALLFLTVVSVANLIGLILLLSR